MGGEPCLSSRGVGEVDSVWPAALERLLGCWHHSVSSSTDAPGNESLLTIPLSCDLRVVMCVVPLPERAYKEGNNL